MAAICIYEVIPQTKARQIGALIAMRTGFLGNQTNFRQS